MSDVPQSVINAYNASLGGAGQPPPSVTNLPGGTIPSSQGIPALPTETRDPSGNVVVPPSTVQRAPADVGPATVPLRFKAQSGVNERDLDPRLTERANRLYDLMPEAVRERAEISSARRSREQ